MTDLQHDAETDDALVAALRRGDRRAQARLYRAHAGWLYREVIHPRVGRSDAAEDALAETFRRAFDRAAQYRGDGESGLRGWLARIGARAAIDVHRREARKGRALERYERLVVPLRKDPTPPDVRVLRTDEGANLRAKLERTLDAINPRYKRAIELRLVEERSREDCAAALDVKLGTFDVLFLRALRAFRKAWSEMEAA